jgi:hypothetical protein
MPEPVPSDPKQTTQVRPDPKETEPPDWNQTGQAERDIYKAALDFVVAVSSNTWARFNAMLVVHAILVAVCASMMFGEYRAQVPVYAPMVLLLAGLLVCLPWWASIERGLKYQDRYVDFAKILEGRFPKPEFKLLTFGDAIQGSFPASVRTRQTQRIVIFVFVALYVAALAYVVVPLVWPLLFHSKIP